MRKHYVQFFSPGTFVAETTTREIDSWDVQIAVDMSGVIIERYSAKPYGFKFLTMLTSDPIDDGEGGLLEVEPKKVEESGMYHLGGKLETLEEVETRDDPKERILRANMRGNGYDKIVINTNSWKSMHPFREGDVLLETPDWGKDEEEN